MSMTPEEKRARKLEKMRLYGQANKHKIAERKRLYRQVNKENEAEQKRRYYEANKEKHAEKNRQYKEANKEKVMEGTRRYRQSNNDKVVEWNSRYCRRKSFTRENGSSLEAWLASLVQPAKVFAAIANLQPDPGQTLAELIHELSGYAMDVCEQIANPPVAEDSPELTPPPDPDLF